MPMFRRRSSPRLRRCLPSSIALGALVFLTACGESVPGDVTAAGRVTAPAPATNAPVPNPVSAAPAVAAAPAGAELYTLGGLTWSFEGDAPDDVRGWITNAMNYAINQTNTLADYRGNVVVVYSRDTPTADAGYQWRIRFGGTISARVALHELGHWLGSGLYGPWEANVANGRFTGAITNRRIKAYDGPDAVVNADRFHFWPYGLLNEWDPVDSQRNVSIVSAQRGDMGLSDGVAAIVGERRFTNRSSGLFLDNTATQPRAAANGTGSLGWQVTFVDGFVVLANTAGQVLDGLGNTADGAATALAASSGSAAQQWEIIPTDTGWFQLRNRQTGKCLDNTGNQAVGAPIAVWSCGGHPNQQWHLAR